MTPTPVAASPLPLKGAPLAVRRSRSRGGCMVDQAVLLSRNNCNG